MKFMGNVVLIWRNTTTNNTTAVTQRLPPVLAALSCVYSNSTKFECEYGLLAFKATTHSTFKIRHKEKEHIDLPQTENLRYGGTVALSGGMIANVF